MGLSKQVISIPMKLGVDTKESPILVDNARTLALSNVVFDRGAQGEMHKRWGTTLIPSTDISGNPLANEFALAVFNGEIDLVAGGQFYALGLDLDAFIPRGVMQAWSVTENAIEKGPLSTSNVDSATLSGITVYAWVEPNPVLSIPSIYAKVIGESTGVVYHSKIKLVYGLTGLSNPKVLVVGTKIQILCSTGLGSIVSFAMDPATPQTIGAAHAIIADSTLVNNSPFDAAVVNGDLEIVANVSGATYLYDCAISTLTVTSSVSVAGQQSIFISVIASALNVYVLLTFVTTGVHRVHGYFYSVPALTLIRDDQLATGDLLYIRLTAAPATSTSVYVFWEIVAANSLNTIKLATHSSSTGPATVGVVAIGVGLASQPFQLSGVTYLLTVFPSSVQQTFYLLQFTNGTVPAIVQGKFYQLNAGPAPSNNRLPQFQQVASGKIGIAVTDQVSIESVNAKVVVIDGVAELVLNYLSDGLGSATPTIRAAQLGQNLHLATGMNLWAYDGSNLTEAEFLVYPEKPTLTFLTSQLAIVIDNQDPTGATPQAFSIYVPDNGATPGGAVGNLIMPGEYFCLDAFTQVISGSPSSKTPTLCWFKVGASGSAPSGANFAAFTKIQISVNATMTAAEVANAIYIAIFGGSPFGYTVAQPAPISLTSGWVGYRIACTATQPGLLLACQPALNTVFSVMQMFQGNSGGPSTAGPSWAATCCPTSLIQPGQYFLFCYNTTGTPSLGYIWFKVAGVGTDPNPIQNSGQGIEVDLVGGETADAVAVLLAAAITAAALTNMTASASGPVVFVTGTAALGPISSAVFAYNPALVGVEQGYIGANANGVASLLALNYVATYLQVDAQGQAHESAPSVPVTAYIPNYPTVGGTYPPAGTLAAPNAVIQVNVQNLTLTLRNNVYIAIYRTESDPPAEPLAQVYYSVTNPPESTLANSAASATPATFVDYSSDTSILSNQALYTSGGVVEHDAPPAAGFILNHLDRLWLCQLEDPNLWWYSGEFENGQGVWWSEAQTVRLNPSTSGRVGGPSIGGASMDGNLVAFQLYQPWLIAGQGPDNTGNNGAFEAQAITSHVGCRDPGSIVVTPDGVMRKTTEGIYLLNRQLADGYAGVDVASFNADIISRAIIVDNGTKALFLSFGGTTQLFDFFYGSWSQLGYQAVDAVIGPTGAYTFIRVDGTILQEDPGVFNDNGTGYQMSITTAKLKFAGVNGYQRLWKFFLQGQFISDREYQVSITYDDEASPTDVFTYTPTANCTTLRVDNSRQLCKAVTINVVDISPYETATTWALDSIDLEIGVRKGGTKTVGSTRSLG